MTLAAARTHLRLDDGLTADDGDIGTLITVAREYCEDFTHRGVGASDYELVIDRFPSDRNYIELPVYPLVSVAYVKYVDTAGTTTTMDTANYIVDTDRMPGAIFLPFCNAWPSALLQPGAAVRIRFAAGHQAADVPQRMLQAMKLLIGHWYNNRDEVVEGKAADHQIPMGVRSLLQPLKVW